jgi:hypothetical protein
MKQNLFKLVICLAMLCASSTATAAPFDFLVDGIYYNKLTNNTCEVTHRAIDNTPSYSGDIVIPQEVSYKGTTYSVTSIGIVAFFGCTGLTSITIPSSVTDISSSTFYGCTGLTSVTIPNSVTSIASYAFCRCSKLISATIPNLVASIGGYAYSGCYGLISVSIPSSVTSIGKYAFYNCSDCA